MTAAHADVALFDLDGTLIDSAPDIHAAATAMLRDLSLPDILLDEARDYIGDGMPRFVKRALTRQWWGEPPADLLACATESMNKHYARECTVGRRVYDGVANTLTTLQQRGWKLACVTNKPTRFTEPVLAACALADFFDTVVCGDSLPAKKPNPLPLRHACAEMQSDCSHAWMIGDSVADSAAATAAGCRFIAVSYGYHRAGQLPPAEYVAKCFADILTVL